MADINVEETLYHLGFPLQKALDASIRKTMPGAEPNTEALYREFLAAVRSQCSKWEYIPDNCIRVDLPDQA